MGQNPSALLGHYSLAEPSQASPFGTGIGVRRRQGRKWSEALGVVAAPPVSNRCGNVHAAPRAVSPYGRPAQP